MKRILDKRKDVQISGAHVIEYWHYLFLYPLISESDKLDTKRMILQTFAALTLLVGMVSAITTLPQSASAFF
jgi:hypothetical protein